MPYNIGCYCCYSNFFVFSLGSTGHWAPNCSIHHSTALSRHPTVLLPEYEFLIFLDMKFFITNREHGWSQRKCDRKLKTKAKPFVILVYFKEKPPGSTELSSLANLIHSNSPIIVLWIYQTGFHTAIIWAECPIFFIPQHICCILEAHQWKTITVH